MRQLGGVLGIALAIAVFTRTGSLACPAGFTVGFSPALLTVAGLSLLGAIAAGQARRPPTRCARP